MDIDLLRTFLEVYRTRHFGQAADNLFVTQSAVSARIKLLEDTMGVPLLTRARSNIQLTPAGQRFLRYAENIVTTWNRARQDVAASRDDSVLLAVGGVSSLWDISLQAWLQWLHDRHPEISVNADVAPSEAMLRRLLDGTLDLAFMFEAPQVADLEVCEIMSVPLILVDASPGRTVEQAVARDYVLVDWGTSFGLAHAKHFPDIPLPRMRLALGRLARDLILTRGGAAYLAEPMIIDALGEGRLHRVEGAPVIDRSAYAVYALGSERRDWIRRVLSYFPAVEPDQKT